MKIVNNEVRVTLEELGELEVILGTPPSFSVNEFHFWADTRLDELAAEGNSLMGDIAALMLYEIFPNLITPSERPISLRNSH